MTRVTAVLATLFFVNSLVLAHLASNRPVAESVIDRVEQTSTTSNAISTDVSGDIPSDVSVDSSSDVPSESINESDVPDMPAESESQTETVMDKAKEGTDSIHDDMDSIKEDIKSALEEVMPNDVPE